jgi:hypothetical protein
METISSPKRRLKLVVHGTKNASLNFRFIPGIKKSPFYMWYTFLSLITYKNYDEVRHLSLNMNKENLMKQRLAKQGREDEVFKQTELRKN